LVSLNKDCQAIGSGKLDNFQSDRLPAYQLLLSQFNFLSCRWGVGGLGEADCAPVDKQAQALGGAVGGGSGALDNDGGELDGGLEGNVD
jgi:hypothetical protein